MSELSVRVAILGAGTAGINALREVRRVTDDFLLIDPGPLGTTCARVGCIPSKLAIHAADLLHDARAGGEVGLTGTDALGIDWRRAWARLRAVRDASVERVIAHGVEPLGERYLAERAEFLDASTLRVGAHTVRAGSIIIATGSRPIVPDAWRGLGPALLTTDELFELETLPRSMAVVGLGAIGLELGQALCRLGVEVVGIDAREYVGGLSDPVLREQATSLFGEAFPLWLGAPATAEAVEGGVAVAAGGRRVVVERVLMCIGRAPNVAGLGLEHLGLPLDGRGLPPFDPHTMQVGDVAVYLAGDVNGERPILHEAAAEGRIAGHNAVRERPEAFRRKAGLGIIFCQPNLAEVGLRWHELDPERTVVGEASLEHNGRARILGRNRGVIRVYGDGEDGRLLGGALMCPDGEHLAHPLCWAVEDGWDVFRMLGMPFYHPVLEEALQAALQDLARQVHDAPPQPWGLRRL